MYFKEVLLLNFWLHAWRVFWQNQTTSFKRHTKLTSKTRCAFHYLIYYLNFHDIYWRYCTLLSIWLSLELQTWSAPKLEHLRLFLRCFLILLTVMSMSTTGKQDHKIGYCNNVYWLHLIWSELTKSQKVRVFCCLSLQYARSLSGLFYNSKDPLILCGGLSVTKHSSNDL